MKLQPAAILVGLVVACPCQLAEAETSTRAGPGILVAQASDGAASQGVTSVPPVAAPAPGATAVGSSSTGGTTGVTPPTTGPGTSKRGTAPAASITATPVAPLPTATTRNGNAFPPTVTQQGATALGSGASSITFGGPQVDVQPTLGSPLRDPGTGNGGVPIYSNTPSTLGGPINGTANAYDATLPNRSVGAGKATSASRGAQTPNGDALATKQPLGAQPYTRDQTGTFGGTASGYNAQGVYNGTATSANGYGSPYAGNGRPIGGLLSTGVDASGPLRPYIPLNNSPIGRPNSGYGTPNGARSTHMDARGIQRLD